MVIVLMASACATIPVSFPEGPVKQWSLALLNTLQCHADTESHLHELRLQADDEGGLRFYWQRFQFMIDVFAEDDKVHMDGNLFFRDGKGQWMDSEFFFSFDEHKDKLTELVNLIANGFRMVTVLSAHGSAGALPGNQADGRPEAAPDLSPDSSLL
jgi:hypothetical protein